MLVASILQNQLKHLCVGCVHFTPCAVYLYGMKLFVSVSLRLFVPTCLPTT